MSREILYRLADSTDAEKIKLLNEDSKYGGIEKWKT